DGTKDVYFAGTIVDCSGNVPIPGLLPHYSISGYTYEDDNNDGIFQGVGTTKLVVTAVNSSATDVNGANMAPMGGNTSSPATLLGDPNGLVTTPVTMASAVSDPSGMAAPASTGLQSMVASSRTNLTPAAAGTIAPLATVAAADPPAAVPLADPVIEPLAVG